MKRKARTGKSSVEVGQDLSTAEAQRREMQIHADGAERAADDDREFFEIHPARTYRVRLLSQAERAQFEIVDGPLKGPAGAPIAFAAIKRIAPPVRMRVVVFGQIEAAGQHLSDAEAGEIWEGYADHHPSIRERESRIRDALQRFGCMDGSEGKSA